MNQQEDQVADRRRTAWLDGRAPHPVLLPASSLLATGPPLTRADPEAPLTTRRPMLGPLPR